MEPLFSTLGTTIGLALAIALVMLRMQPAYALMVGALVGGLAGLMGAWGGVLTAAAHLAVVWLFLYFLYKQKIFLKI